MKKNLILIASIAVAVFTASCDNKGGTETTASEATATTDPHAGHAHVDNPNVVSATNDAAATTAQANPNAPVIAFTEKEYDFGTVKQGKVIDHTFKFTNTGKSPLIIENASATCGCTVPSWPKEPIAPGGTGEIKVQFDTAGKFGQQAPIITVRANTEPNIVQVQLKGTVEASNIPTNPNGPLRTN